MRSKTKKSVSRLVGIWTFLLVFIFKGIFPKPAYAFLSSLDACAANPECAAAVSSELSPAVSAPTGAGFGASTLSTTTAAGATSSSVQGVAEISVAARLGTLGILYYWNQAQNEQAQNKAKQKYCAAYPTDLVCDAQANVVYNIEATLHSTDGTYSYDYYYSGTAIGSINYANADAPHWITGWSPPLIGIYNNDGIRTGYLGWNYTGTGSYPLDEWAQITGITITSITRQDGQPETPPSPWKDWSQEKRDEAVRLLNDSDWQGLINSMPQAGVLNPGDKINAPTIVIPGEETDDPNTPADERLLRKEHGFFTFPGLPDFDYDLIPDESDPDDDDDGTPDSSDPDPQNPLVPEASNDPSSPPPEPPSPSPSSSPTVPEPGVGGNGIASEFGDMSGMSRADADAFLSSLGATVKTTAGGYTQYKLPDRSEVWIRPDGEVVRTPAPKYGSDNKRINRGFRLDKDGSLLKTQDEFGNEIPQTHNTGEKVSN